MEKALTKATDICFYLTAGETWEKIYEDCLHAKKSIQFEQYIILDDAVGNSFLKLFAEKAKQGVTVHLILDAIGSRSVLFSPFIEEIENYQGRVVFYNPPFWWKIFFPSRWFPRNHAKTMLIDSEIAYIGGVCLAEYMRGWRDTQARFTGLLVEDVKQDFLCIWERLTKNIKSTFACLTPVDAPLRYVVNLPHLGESPIYKELLAQIQQAKEHIYLVTPFFFPPRKLRKYLKQAVRRGIGVTIIVAAKTDVRLADIIGQSYFHFLIKKGIRIALYTEGTLHAKYAVIDGKWATVGSTNLDYLSLLINREANIITTDATVVAELTRHFFKDIQSCINVDKAFMHNRPFFHKLMGYVGRMIKKLL